MVIVSASMQAPLISMMQAPLISASMQAPLISMMQAPLISMMQARSVQNLATLTDLATSNGDFFV